MSTLSPWEAATATPACTEAARPPLGPVALPPIAHKALLGAPAACARRSAGRHPSSASGTSTKAPSVASELSSRSSRSSRSSSRSHSRSAPPAEPPQPPARAPLRSERGALRDAARRHTTGARPGAVCASAAPQEHAVGHRRTHPAGLLATAGEQATPATEAVEHLRHPRDGAVLRLIFNDARRRHVARATYQDRAAGLAPVQPRAVLLEAVQDVVAAARKCVKSAHLLRELPPAAHATRVRTNATERLPPVRAKTLAVDRFQNLRVQVQKEHAKQEQRADAAAEAMWQRLLASMDLVGSPSGARPAKQEGPADAEAAAQPRSGSWVWARRASSAARALMPSGGRKAPPSRRA